MLISGLKIFVNSASSVRVKLVAAPPTQDAMANEYDALGALR